MLVIFIAQWYPEWFIAPVYGDGHEGVFNKHGFGEAGWQAEAEEHSEGGKEQPFVK